MSLSVFGQLPRSSWDGVFVQVIKEEVRAGEGVKLSSSFSWSLKLGA